MLGSGIVAAALLTAVVVAVAVAWWVRRQTAQLRTITTAAQQLRDGEDVEIPQLEHPLEVAVLSSALRELTSHLARRNTELEERTADLSRALRVRDQFTMMASHETRTPIAVIRGAIETLRRHDSALPEDAKERLRDAIARNAERLERLTTHLLAAAEVEATLDQESPARDRVRPSEVLGRLAQPNVEVAGPDDLEVETDASLLELAVSNLLDNATKYGEPPVRVSFEHTEDNLQVTVRDHGEGVPSHFHERLFDRYSQASEGSQRTAVGVGLGLWLSRELLRRAGGDLVHEPVEGPGARFTAELPARPL